MILLGALSMKKRIVFFVTIFLILNLLNACSGLSSKQKTEAEESLKALQKIAAATEVGVNYQLRERVLSEAVPL